MKILIIGGGISGLAVALALHRTGQQVTVFERSQAIQEVGAGLTIWPNAIRVLQELGLTNVIPEIGMPAHYRTIRTWRGALLSQIEVDAIAGSPMRLMHRADLQGALFNALRDASIPVELGARCTGFSQDENGVHAQFADGRTADGDLLVGADGIRSVVRGQLFGIPNIHYTGYTSWRGIAEVDARYIPLGISSETWGVGRRIGLIPLRNGRMYWFAAYTTPEGQGKDQSSAERKQEVQELFRGWHDPIEPILEATDRSRILRNDVYDIAPLAHWSQGRVVLVGDAAHAMSPNMGQGGCQAIEDAPVLAQCIQASADIPTALHAYEARRKPRTSRVARQSRRIGQLSQVNNPQLYPVRNILVKALYTRALSKELKWLLQSTI
ncbi:FAD-dependent oxidoreductase [Dictyobacter formicarum]|uniref:FAD-dependent oxidoreductase n=1 Tax=Dictyobacter formicarum TaxID=2778368 RepID=A0ABQ3VF29_9CHLR|nr:FAD-dependent oxidoreductase [Dictyobacter formicarum]GHO84767.1 FAD-dependent oxidoreductase [Dictyobacter formicarum]